MFKGSNPLANVTGLNDARTLIDITIDELYASTFTVEKDGLTVEANGRHQVTSVSGVSLGADALQGLLADVWAKVNHDLMVRLVRVRNTVQKKHRVDIANSMPEVAEALAYMDAKQAK
jgi:hypothetical protein